MTTKEKSLNDYARVLTSRGYAIRKDTLTPQEQQKIRQELTVAPKTMARAAAAGKPFTVYYESPQRFYLPRHWARDVFGKEEADAMPEGVDLPTSLKFTGKPFDYQEAILKTFTDADANGLICVPCGKGKTFMALCLAARLGKRFLVIVDKEFLLNQWKGEMEAFFPGLRVGIIKEDKAQIGFIDEIPEKEPTIPELKDKLRKYKLRLGGTKDELIARLREVEPAPLKEEKEKIKYDCCIAMIQTIVRRDFSSNVFKEFGFSIFDECHHLGASNFSQALLKVQTKCMLGLSATPTRDDGLSKVFEWYLGKPVYWEKRREADPTVIVKAMQFHQDNPAYAEIPVDFKGEPVLARLLGQVVDCKERNEWIVQQILDLVKDPSRRILVLGERIKQLEVFEQGLAAADPTLVTGYYIGGMKEAKREDAGKNARVLLASYAMASEAMNIKSLNTVVLASPRKKVEQSVGRILRERPSERRAAPLILDIVDSHGVYQGQWRKRRVFYKACGYKIQIQQYKSDETSEDSRDDEPVEKSAPIQPGVCGFVDDC